MKKPDTGNKTSVFLVEDHNLVRRVMGQLIQRDPSLTLCGTAPTAEIALALIPDLNPQLTVVDISLPGMNGIELIHLLHQKYPHMRLLALSGHDESIYGAPVMQAGGHGYVMKGKVDEIEEALHQVSRGSTYLSPQLRAILNSSPNH